MRYVESCLPSPLPEATGGSNDKQNGTHHLSVALPSPGAETVIIKVSYAVEVKQQCQHSLLGVQQPWVILTEVLLI